MSEIRTLVTAVSLAIIIKFTACFTTVLFLLFVFLCSCPNVGSGPFILSGMHGD